MSILIKGMDMPKSCRECELFINCDDCEGFETQCAILGQLGYLVDIPKDFRHQNCPLVEVKTPHGRLIDADALRARMYHEAFETDTPMQRWESGCWIRYKLFERAEEAAPTIIPAEED